MARYESFMAASFVASIRLIRSTRIASPSIYRRAAVSDTISGTRSATFWGVAMDSTTSFGYWVRRRRKALDLTQEELADQAGCAVGTIRKIENDSRRPSRQLAALLADHLLLSGDERTAFLQAARAECVPDLLALPTMPEASFLATNIEPRHNLPVPATSLIGREREIAAVSALLQDDNIRLVTLSGTGGAGKSRLAIETGRNLLNDFPDGVWFVGLASLRDPDLVVTTIAQVLGVTETGGQPLIDSLKHYLRDRQLLLVIDNFEHMLTAAPVLADLLATAPRLKLLITSREPLHLYGENEFNVPPLELPDPHESSLEQLMASEGVRLFCERARAVRAVFALDESNAALVAEICRRLDGLPLAVELAAARIKMLTPQAILARMKATDRHAIFQILTSGARDLPARQQTLRNTIDWSYALLDAGEQVLFARLAVFVGGWTLEAAEAVCNAADDLAIDVFNGIMSLVDKSLLLQVEGPGGESRFTMLETIREYALERLAERGETHALQRRHAEFFLALAEEAEDHLLDSAPTWWLERLDAENDNLRASLAWSQTAPDADLEFRLAGALGQFWIIRGYNREGRDWVDHALRRAKEATWSDDTEHQGEQRIKAKLLLQAGRLAQALGDFAQGRIYLEESGDLYRRLGDDLGLARSLTELGVGAEWGRGDYAAARILQEQSVALFRPVGSKAELAFALICLAGPILALGDHMQAQALFEESMAIYRELGNKTYMTYASAGLAGVAIHQGDFERHARCTRKLCQSCAQRTTGPQSPAGSRGWEQRRCTQGSMSKQPLRLSNP
jgi:predicted ATPase/transcriptional regulator with XRE-family HTH domain